MYDRAFLMDNPIQEYAWGSHSAIAELLGRDAPSAEPQAELWMGAHPKAPSKVRVDGRWVSLIDLIARDPKAILGEPVVRRFGPRLPFLFKVLAAAQPLSIQAHPNAVQAREGFEREDRLGVAIDAPQRNYRDSNHKPECICALTDFWALSGFRRSEDSLKRLSAVWPEAVSPALEHLQRQPDVSRLKDFFQTLMTLEANVRMRLICESQAAAGPLRGQDPAFDWMLRLADAYPGDAGVLAPLFLNLVHLSPGQALYLGPGQLHAYLEGLGVELMANSDNVLRGGLTPKHVDVAELLKTLVFDPLDPQPLQLQPLGTGESVYHSGAEEFRLSVVTVTPAAAYTGPQHHSVEVLLCTAGEARLEPAAAGPPMSAARGDALLLAAALGSYRICGEAVFYKAAVPV